MVNCNFGKDFTMPKATRKATARTGRTTRSQASHTERTAKPTINTEQVVIEVEDTMTNTLSKSRTKSNAKAKVGLKKAQTKKNSFRQSGKKK